MTEWIVVVTLALLLTRWAVMTGLSGLNLAHTLNAPDAVPAPLAGEIDAEEARRGRDYAAVRLRLSLLEGAVGLAFVLVVLFSGLLPWLDESLAAWGVGGLHRSVAFVVALMVLDGVVGLPFTLYSTFGIERRFGFNRQTWRLWLADRLKGLALSAVLGLPVLYGVFGFMRATGDWWWLWVFAFITVVQLVLLWLYPALIAPLFNKFEPLPDGELKERVQALADEAGFRTRGVYVMDASRRSGHSNAFFVGLWRPRIVLFDTLLEQMDADGTLAVLAHEIGHYRLRHIVKRLVVNTLATAALLWVLSRLGTWDALYAAFGLASSDHALLTLAVLVGGAALGVLQPLGAWFSRRHEYAADAYSVRLFPRPEALKRALVQLNRENLANLYPHPWYVAVHYSHPTLLQRLRAIDRLAAQRTAPAAAG